MSAILLSPPVNSIMVCVTKEQSLALNVPYWTLSPIMVLRNNLKLCCEQSVIIQVKGVKWMSRLVIILVE